MKIFSLTIFAFIKVGDYLFCPLRGLKIIDPIRPPSSGERCTVTRSTPFVIFMVDHYV